MNMNIISKLKCAFTYQGSLKDFYNQFSNEELEKRINNLWMTYASLGISWLMTFFIILITSEADFVVMMFFTTSVFSIFITFFTDYNHRKKIIQKIINDRENIG